MLVFEMLTLTQMYLINLNYLFQRVEKWLFFVQNLRQVIFQKNFQEKHSSRHKLCE